MGQQSWVKSKVNMVHAYNSWNTLSSPGKLKKWKDLNVNPLPRPRTISVEVMFDNPRIQNCLKELRRRAKVDAEESNNGLHSWHLHVCSENNFPTAAGLASSAAGYACLVYTLAKLYGVKGDISSIARQGSGSACRSVLGGFVRWHKGCDPTGLDSIAQQIAIKERNFEMFAELTMKDSNQFHAMCLDTYPPALYMNDMSHSIVHLIHLLNSEKGRTKVAYTFDAGSNACLYLLESDVSAVLSAINHVFPPANDSVEYLKGLPVNIDPLDKKVAESLAMKPHESGSLKFIIHTQLGEGPQVVQDLDQHLLTPAGDPKFLNPRHDN
uniref:Diphosphomevalonate decarboxylase n=1 Tax=Timema monikensis TaxID=170555 RepID=A0A7R9E6H3_9NEOP|nr:unnamed protein product [Timema monikensis]